MNRENKRKKYEAIIRYTRVTMILLVGFVGTWWFLRVRGRIN